MFLSCGSLSGQCTSSAQFEQFWLLQKDSKEIRVSCLAETMQQVQAASDEDLHMAQVWCRDWWTVSKGATSYDVSTKLAHSMWSPDGRGVQWKVRVITALLVRSRRIGSYCWLTAASHGHGLLRGSSHAPQGAAMLSSRENQL